MAQDKTIAAMEARLERIETALINRLPPVFDPSPEDWPRWGGWNLPDRPGRWPIPGDPVPIDISRLNKAQLEVSPESIKAQRIRLDAMENMIGQEMKRKR